MKTITEQLVDDVAELEKENDSLRDDLRHLQMKYDSLTRFLNDMRDVAEYGDKVRDILNKHQF